MIKREENPQKNKKRIKMDKKVKIILFQKDEHELLPDWIRYHAWLFGRDSIHIIDHKSDNKTMDIIKDNGIKYNIYEGHFGDKYKELTRVMKNFKKKYDILIPIDSDEFVAYSENKVLDINREKIQDKINRLPNDFRYKFSEWRAVDYKEKYEDDLIDMNKFHLCNQGKHSKTFFPAKQFMSTDQGNHLGSISSSENKWIDSGLCMIHFHTRGYLKYKEKMIRGKKAYGIRRTGGTHYRSHGEFIGNTNDEKTIIKKWKSYSTHPIHTEDNGFAKLIKQLREN